MSNEDDAAVTGYYPFRNPSKIRPRLGPDVPRLCEGFLRGSSPNNTVAPRSRFAAEEDILGAKEGLTFDRENLLGKLFLGVYGAKVKEDRNPDTGRLERSITGGTLVGVRDDRHIITVAGSRAGKGRAALIPNLLTYPGSMLIIDPKGELAAKTSHRRTEMGQAVHILDPFGEGRSSASFNPLQILKNGSPTLVEDAGLIADALVVPSVGTSDPHWDESAKNFIETLVLHVATSPLYEGKRDLVTVYEQLTRALKMPPEDKSKDRAEEADDESERMFELEAELSKNDAEDGAVIAGARDFYDRGPNERTSVLSSVRRHLHFIGYRQMKPCLRSGGTLDLADLKKKRVTVYLILPALRMGTCSRWLRLFVNLTLAQMETVRQLPKHAVLLCLDEFAVLGTMKTIEDAAGQIAGLGVKLWPVLQDLGQLKALYGDRWETFLGNAGVLQFFGNSDLTTLEWISKRLGETTVTHASSSTPTHRARNEEGQKGESSSETTHPLMTPEEVSRFFGRDDHLLRQIIIRPSFPPMVLQRANSDTHEPFKKMLERADAGSPEPFLKASGA